MSAPSIRAAKAGLRRVTVIGVMVYGHRRKTSFSSLLGTVSRIQVNAAALGHLAGALEKGGQGQARERAAHADPLHAHRRELRDGEIRDPPRSSPR